MQTCQVFNTSNNRRMNKPPTMQGFCCGFQKPFQKSFLVDHCRYKPSSAHRRLGVQEQLCLEILPLMTGLLNTGGSRM